MNIKDNIEKLLFKINQSDPHVRVLLATKTQSIEDIQLALDCGINLLGENKSQELLEKIGKVKGEFDWHFIGSLQSNKVKDVLPLCKMIHSVDRIKLAKEINKEAAKLGIVQDILLQVNTSYEESKSGFSPEELIESAKEIIELENVRVCGLMTMAKNTDDPKDWRECFRLLKSQFDELKSNLLSECHFCELSMGMSRDYEIAIEEGATIVRLGSAIFGARL